YESIKEEVNRGHRPSATLGEWWQETAASGSGLSGAWDFYEWHDGKLRSAGELPDHTYSPYGAVPAVTENITGLTLKFPLPRLLLNQVSQDGSKAFFISPQNLHASEAGSPTELYVREQTEAGPKTLLVSRDESGLPAPAPGCTQGASFEACAETAVTPVESRKLAATYVYASPDGSRAFFESKDKLTSSAPEGAEPKTYEFNLQTEKVTYLPGVVGPIAASSQDGSSFIFKNTEKHEIELWSGGPTPDKVASFSTPAHPVFECPATKHGA